MASPVVPSQGPYWAVQTGLGPFQLRRQGPVCSSARQGAPGRFGLGARAARRRLPREATLWAPEPTPRAAGEAWAGGGTRPAGPNTTTRVIRRPGRRRTARGREPEASDNAGFCAAGGLPRRGAPCHADEPGKPRNRAKSGPIASSRGFKS
jgi:hypothetical protein